jgi:hypothetical protein
MTAGGVLLLLVAGAAGTTWAITGNGGSPRPRASARAAPGRAAVPVTTPATFSGPAGVEAAWVVAENRRPGNPGWEIGAPPPGTIDGFADHVFATAGDTVTLYVSTDAPSFHVEAYRMGYYGGAGARLVWTSAGTTGVAQPGCPAAYGTNMVACDNWSPSLSFPVTAGFVQGDYLLKLVGSGGQASYVPLTVSDPKSHAAYVVKNDVYTWQAWNPYGGYDFYAGLGRCPRGVYPLCSRARVVSFDRPYGYGDGAGDFLGNEYPLVRFAEQHGLDVTYATDLNLEQDPGLLLDHRALLSLGHDECWSLDERVAAQTAESKGVNIAFFAASPVLRHVRPEASPLGPDREVVDYRDSFDDPLYGTGDPREVTGNTWSEAPTSWPEVPFVGEAYSGFLEPDVPPAPFVVADAAAWIFQGTGLRNGAQVPGVLATDFDQFDPGSHPADLQILGHSPIPVREAQSSRRVPFSDMTYYTNGMGGAGVFDSGVNSWIPSLSPCAPSVAACPATVVGQMTANLFALFGRGPAGRTEPSTANWSTFYP